MCVCVCVCVCVCMYVCVCVCVCNVTSDVSRNKKYIYMGHSPENWTKEGAAFPMK